MTDALFEAAKNRDAVIELDSCPHCGCTDFCVEWRKDLGDGVDAVECNNCHAVAPISWWNVRWEDEKVLPRVKPRA